MSAIDEVAMAEPVSTPYALPPTPRPAWAFAVAGSVLGAIVLLGTVALWGHYGTAVFFEMITSGFAACF